MKRMALLLLATSILMPVLAAQAQTVEPYPDAASDPVPVSTVPNAAQMESLLNQVVSESVGCIGKITDFRREVIVPGIAHYWFKVRVGRGPYEVIGIHRVVKERRAFQPIKARKALFMLPGGWYRFDNLYLAALNDPTVPDTHAFPVFAAQRDYDIWGIDLDWSLVPAGLPDYSFMKTWDMERDARHTLIALGIARAARAGTGSGSGPLNLLGYSLSYMVGFVAAQMETSLPPSHRSIKGYVAIDGYFVCEACADFACALFAAELDQMSNGIYVDSSGELFNTIGSLAATAPNEESPILPGMTNMQAALLFIGQTWQLSPENPIYHLYAPVVDQTGFPTGLQYTQLNYSLNWLQHASYSVPLRDYADWNEALCGQTDSPLDDHLGDVTIPVFAVASAGGTGTYGLPTLSLLGSKDKTFYVARLHPVGEETMDFGHVDVWLADNAPEMVWEPLLQWLSSH